jgi:hypothetical protein
MGKYLSYAAKAVVSVVGTAAVVAVAVESFIPDKYKVYVLVLVAVATSLGVYHTPNTPLPPTE